MKMLVFLLGLVIAIQSVGQNKYDNDKKLSPFLKEVKGKLKAGEEQPFFIVVTDVKSFKEFLSNRNLSDNIISLYEPSKLFVLKINQQSIDSVLILSPLVRFIDIVRIPKEEIAMNGFDLSTNKINHIHSSFKSINGNGLVVSIKENKPDSNDIDLKERFIPTRTAAPVITSHATIMSTIVAGAGNSFYTGKGVAWEAAITSSNFATLLPDQDAVYKKDSISLQNHSYGTGIENYYGADAAAFDASTLSNPSLLHVFSSGNSGDKSNQTGPYAAIDKFANLTGSFKMAKNIITVGAIDSFYNVSLLSSRGPAYDGRIRPELVAFGQEGSSGAAALVSGTALLLQHIYKEQTSGQLPNSALVKCVLINSADDVDATGIDFKSGFGSLNAYNAIQGMINKRYFSGTLSGGQLQRFSLNIPANIQQLKITICWNDVPSSPNNNKSLINDLDMKLIHSTSGTTWQPWVLNSYPHIDSLTQLAVRKRDTLNNIEQVTIDRPVEGDYQIEVVTHALMSGSQPYYISYQWDTIDKFKWHYPTSNDHIVAGRKITLRWSSTYNINTGTLYYSVDEGKQWNIIDENINPNTGHYNWTAPDTLSSLIFRMFFNNERFLSDTSTISRVLSTGVGFNCADSFLIYWDKEPHVSSYTVYALADKYLAAIAVTNDSSIVLKKSLSPASHYAISANVINKPGIKSYSFDYNTQGTGCYFKSFLVDLANTDKANIQLELGTAFNVRSITVEKRFGNSFVPLQTISTVATTKYVLIDGQLISGGNIYRVRIDLKDGKIIYSHPETLYYLPNINYLVFPNPALTNFQIVSKDNDDAELILYNITGQKVLVKKLASTVQNIPVQHLNRGLYFLQILKNDKSVYRGSITIQ